MARGHSTGTGIAKQHAQPASEVHHSSKTYEDYMPVFSTAVQPVCCCLCVSGNQCLTECMVPFNLVQIQNADCTCYVLMKEFDLPSMYSLTIRLLALYHTTCWVMFCKIFLLLDLQHYLKCIRSYYRFTHTYSRFTHTYKLLLQGFGKRRKTSGGPPHTTQPSQPVQAHGSLSQKQVVQLPRPDLTLVILNIFVLYLLPQGSYYLHAAAEIGQ